VPAAGLVPGDIVKLSLGAVVAADVRLIEGEILLDQSTIQTHRWEYFSFAPEA
jgi:H+-transporting ATPase